MNDTYLRWVSIILLLITFLLVRWFVLFYPESSGWSVVDDELPTGNIAADWQTGLILPAPAYQFKPFAAGTMVVGFLSLPFRHLFGPNLLALKATVISLHLLAMLFWLLFMWRIGGRVAALAFGVLSVFAPPAWLHLTHTAWANHAEQVFFIGLLLWLLSFMWRGRGASNPPHIGLFFLCGLVAGLSVYFSYTGLPTVVWLFLLIALMSGQGKRLRFVLVSAGGVFIGLSPLVWSASYYGVTALGRIDTYTGYAEGALVSANRFFIEQQLAFLPQKLLRFLFSDLPTASLYDPAWARWLFYVFVIGLSACWIMLLRKPLANAWRGLGRGGVNRDGVKNLLQLAPLLYGVLFSLVFLFSGFRVVTPGDPAPADYANYRYLATLFPVAFALVGLGLQSVWDFLAERVSLRLVLAAVIVVVMMALSVPYYRAMVHGPYSGLVTQVRGDYYPTVLERLAITMSRHEWSRQRRQAILEKVPKRYRHSLFELMGKIGEQGVEVGLQLIQQPQDRYMTDLTRGFGRSYGGLLAYGETERWPEKVDEALVRANLADSPRRSVFIEGVATGITRASDFHPKQIMVMFNQWQEQRPSDYGAFLFGLGRFGGSTLAIRSMEEEKFPAVFWRGYGRQVRQNAETMLLSWTPVAKALYQELPENRVPIVQGFMMGGELFEE